jgi:hypothetical protein
MSCAQVRNVPKSRKAQNLDRQSVQRLAQETLAGHRQVFSFSLQVGMVSQRGSELCAVVLLD